MDRRDPLQPEKVGACENFRKRVEAWVRRVANAHDRWSGCENSLWRVRMPDRAVSVADSSIWARYGLVRCRAFPRVGSMRDPRMNPLGDARTRAGAPRDRSAPAEGAATRWRRWAGESGPGRPRKVAPAAGRPPGRPPGRDWRKNPVKTTVLLSRSRSIDWIGRVERWGSRRGPRRFLPRAWARVNPLLNAMHARRSRPEEDDQPPSRRSP